MKQHGNGPSKQFQRRVLNGCQRELPLTREETRTYPEVTITQGRENNVYEI